MMIDDELDKLKQTVIYSKKNFDIWPLYHCHKTYPFALCGNTTNGLMLSHL